MTDASSKSAGAKALAYAEDQLGVNKVWDDSRAALKALDDTLTQLSEARDGMRALEDKLQLAEMEVVAAEWGKHPEMSAARMESHAKAAKAQDDDVRELRDRILAQRGVIDGLECDREMTNATLRVSSARLQELGGYFQYLAAIKLATVGQTVQPIRLERDPQ